MTTNRARLWLEPGADERALVRFAAERSFRLVSERPRSVVAARTLTFENKDGARIGWDALHEFGVAHAWVEGDSALRDALAQVLPVWELSAVRAAARSGALLDRLRATRVWAVHVAYDETQEPELVDALRALATEEDAIPRAAARQLCYFAAIRHREAIVELAVERADNDPDYASEWRRMAAAIAER